MIEKTDFIAVPVQDRDRAAQFYGEVYDAWIDEETRLHPTPEVVAEWEALLQHAGYLFLARKMIFNLVDRRDLLIDAYDIGSIAEHEEMLLAAVETIRIHGEGVAYRLEEGEVGVAVGVRKALGEVESLACGHLARHSCGRQYCFALLGAQGYDHWRNSR